MAKFFSRTCGEKVAHARHRDEIAQRLSGKRRISNHLHSIATQA
jgi:hypothetical protein